MTAPSIVISGRRIGAGAPPYVIAEVSANHKGSIENAKRLITAARDAGADAVKLQTYTADTITIDHDGPDFRIAGGLWDGYTLYNLYKEAQTPFEWHAELFAHARGIGIDVFSSPFDETAVDLLESLDAPAYKIASFEAVDKALIERAARTGKPLIVSTGMTTPAEIEAALGWARAAGGREIALLHCVSEYPAPADAYNLSTIADLSRRFGVVAGLSDHTLGITVPIAAVAAGASLIEKHFTDKRANGGPDAGFSLEAEELALMCEAVRTAHLAIGEPTYKRSAREVANKQFRRSLYAVADIRRGERFTRDNVRSIRPGYGLPPEKLCEVVGCTAAADIARGTPLSLELIAG